MAVKLLGTVLREELRRTTTVGENGDRDPNKEAQFDQSFCQWVLAQGWEPQVYLLQAEDLINGEGFLRELRKPTDATFSVPLFERLSETLKQKIREGEISCSAVKDLVEDLNRLLQAQELILPKTVEERFEPECKAAFDKYQSQLPRVAINRLYLQAAFPELIVKIWENPAVVYKWIHENPQVEHNAVCLSGGGIRSATFALGILQGLSRYRVLPRFQYLSTVSGGGYTGSWLSGWISRQGFKAVLGALANRPANGAKNLLKPEPEEIAHLREYSNYLTPKLGVVSADTWTLVATYLRNLVLNWCVCFPALALVLIVPRLCVAIGKHEVGDWLLLVALVIGMAGVLTAQVYAALHRPTMRLKDSAKAGQTKFLIFCLLPLYVSAVCLTSVWAWLQQPGHWLGALVFKGLQNTDNPVPWIPFLVFSVGLHLLAWFIYSVWPILRKNSEAVRMGASELFPRVASGALAGLLLWSGARLAHRSFALQPSTELFVSFGAPWYLASFLVSLFFFVGLTSRSTNDEDREWWGRMSAWSIIAIGVWCLFSVLVLFGPDWLLELPRALTTVGGITGLITLFLTHSGSTPANKKEAATSRSTTETMASRVGLALAAPIFIGFFVATLSLATAWLVAKTPPRRLLHNGTTLTAGDIKDFPSLAARLKTHPDTVAEDIWKRLGAALQQQVSDYLATGAGDKETLSSLLRGLNGIVTGELLLAPSSFPPTDVPSEKLSRLSGELQGQDRWQLNRLLLQKSFPTELRQSEFDHAMITHQSPLRSLVGLSLVFLCGAVLLSGVININRFSLHAMYRNRLIRAYLGASNRAREPNAFTGFDPRDNLPMTELKCKPLHVVNMALNLVSGDNLAWQQRKAESFTASPLHAGSCRLGYRNVKDYASRKGLRRAEKHDGGLTLGTAITISGAAASPNMGYHSSPVLAFIMTLFNVRLGAWFGNPGKRGSKCYEDIAPKLAFWQFTREAFGLTNDKDDYVYLSDGGHFENLGLYEMVLRRCRYIVVSDAGCDPNCALEDLGNAIRKIRIDLGIPIAIDKFSIASRTKGESKYCAVGEIKYSAVDGTGVPDGKLIYIKPAIAGDEPKDVYNYKETSLLFPHEPTSDQWFSESQFESYRALGAHVIDTMCRGAGGNWPDDSGANALKNFYDQATEYLSGKPGQFAPTSPAVS